MRARCLARGASLSKVAVLAASGRAGAVTVGLGGGEKWFFSILTREREEERT